jgi:hypothetical protein
LHSGSTEKERIAKTTTTLFPIPTCMLPERKKQLAIKLQISDGNILYCEFLSTNKNLKYHIFNNFTGSLHAAAVWILKDGEI